MIINKTRLRSGLLLALSTSLFAIAPAALAPAAAQGPEFQQQAWDVEEPADPWPFAASDLPVDEEYRFGVLDNGMRYIIRPNGTPEGQGKVYFWVNAGSVNETEDERGFAHFTEHMAFNGSTNVPEGEMIKLLEREGLAFGADTNASTNFNATIYMLDLPRNDEALLGTALMLMRETASELTMSQEAVDREKGIVLSERRVRDTYSLRNTVDDLNFLYPGSRFADRMPIGKVEALEGATSEGLRGFWSRWYRPDNTAVIVVGDFNADTVEAMIKSQFSDWQDDDAPEEPDYGPLDFARAGETDIYLDPALSESISISRNGPYITPSDTVASRRARILRQIGYGIINRRLASLQREDNPPFRSASFSTSEVFEIGRTTGLSIAAREGEWQRGLAATQQIWRQAMQFGFSPAEVGEQAANLASAIQANAAGAATRPNRSFITGALTLLMNEQVPTTPATSLERFIAHSPTITPETVLAALKDDALTLDNPLIRFQGRTAPEGKEEALRAAWKHGMLTPLSAMEQTETADFAYTDFGPAGSVVSDTREAALDIRTLTFASGLKLNLKPTTIQEDRILIQLSIDGGDMLNTVNNPLATAMAANLPSGGLGAHTIDELVSVLAGKQVGLSLGTAAETFQMGGQTVPDDLELQLQLFAAALSDAAYRPQAETQYAQSIENYFARRDATPAGALSWRRGSLLSDGDPRFSVQKKADYLALTMAGLRDEIGDRLANGAMELALVGDFEEDAVIALVAKTLGALPDREAEFREYAENRTRIFTQDHGPHIVYHDGADDQAILQMSWPTQDGSNSDESLQLALLQRVVDVLMTDHLREELGATYSPSVSASQSRIYDDYGVFSLSAAIDTDDVDATRDAIITVMTQLVEAPVSDDVLLRARAPLSERYDNALKANGGWMSLVDRAQSEPDQIIRFTTGKERLLKITQAQLQAMAARYLHPEMRREFIALPKPAE